MKKPLTGLRVLDFTRLFAGPFCTMHLGDLGAEIIKVEEPGEGDPSRTQGPPFHYGYGMSFFAVNRNKKSIILDMRKPEGKEIARRLARKVDVLVENFRPGVMDRLGLGYETLSKENPRLVYASLSGFGADGPHKDRGAFDLTIQAEGGYMSITGERGGAPIKLGTSAFDLICGIFAKGAILAALLQRTETGQGQRIETSLLEAEVSFLTNAAMEYLITGNNPQKWGSEHPQVVPYKAFKTADGWLVIGAGVQRLFESFLRVIGREDLLKDPRFATLGGRVANRETLYAILDAEVLRYNTNDLLERLTAAGVACSPVNNMAEVFKHPQVLHRGMLKHLKHSGCGQVPTVGPAVKYSTCDIADEWAAPPILGEHTQSILKDLLNMSDSDFEALAKVGAVCSSKPA
jgi:crotonobetainyl-CoA:carnitine CoA-transferase CaiB-like acyl-CoA transferase